MWLISSDSPQLGGKRLWLRSGSGHLFGRTSGKSPNGERVQYIEHSSVSRKHLIITVAPNTPGDCTRLLTKPAITIIEGSKFGTHINGNSVKGETRTLDGDKFDIRLGTSDIVLKLEWRPVIFSFAGAVSKTAKANGTVLAAEKEKLECMDIKVSTEYFSNQTTHVIAKKRNTPSGLQALLQARWLLSGSFVDAVAAAGKRDGLDDNGLPRLSPLELDYDACWPSELEHPCPAGSEPVPRPDEYLKPNTQRSEVFDGYTFVFLDPAQHALLMAAVMAGSGKAVCYERMSSSTTAKNVIEYIKELAGKKNDRDLILSDEPGPGGIVIVRPSDKAGGRNSEVLQEIDIALDQRAIEQTELLDVILSNDASVLRRALRDPTQSATGGRDTQNLAQPTFTSGHVTRGAQVNLVSDSPPAESQRATRTDQAPPTTQPGQEIQKQERMEPSSAAGAGRRRRILTQKQFKGFDDIDDSQILKAPSQQRTSPGPSQSRSKGKVDNHEPSQHDSITQPGIRKRPAPDMEIEETEEQLLDRIMPGQAALKRQRLEAVANGEKPFFESPATTASGQKTAPQQGAKGAKSQGKTNKVESNLKAIMVAKREKEEKRYRENKEQTMVDINEEDLEREPGKTEFFDLPVRPPPPQHQIDAGALNPAWAGRPNFKKFVKKGAPPPQQETQNGTKVFIVLEEVPGKDQGIGDDYWLEMGDTDPRHNKRNRGQSKAQALPQSASSSTLPASSTGNTSQPRGENNDEERTAFRRRILQSRAIDAEEDPNSFEPVTTAMQSTLGAPKQGKAAGKRPAATQLSGTAKKARQTALPSSRQTPIRIDGSDDDDPRAFRRKRR